MATHFYTAASLDGFIATAEHSLDWLFAQDFDVAGPMAYPAFIDRIGALVMGASTYAWLLSHQAKWEHSQPAWVFTHREFSMPTGADVRFIQGRPSEHVDLINASAEGKDVWVMGGGDLAAQFARDGVLDELWIQFAPVTLGAGQPLFPRALQLDLIDVARNRVRHRRVHTQDRRVGHPLDHAHRGPPAGSSRTRVDRGTGSGLFRIDPSQR